MANSYSDDPQTQPSCPPPFASCQQSPALCVQTCAKGCIHRFAFFLLSFIFVIPVAVPVISVAATGGPPTHRLDMAVTLRSTHRHKLQLLGTNTQHTRTHTHTHTHEELHLARPQSAWELHYWVTAALCDIKTLNVLSGGKRGREQPNPFRTIKSCSSALPSFFGRKHFRLRPSEPSSGEKMDQIKGKRQPVRLWLKRVLQEPLRETAARVALRVFLRKLRPACLCSPQAGDFLLMVSHSLEGLWFD